MMQQHLRCSPMPAAYDPCPGHPYFPGEPAPEELFLLVIRSALLPVVVGALCWAAARCWPRFMKAARICAASAACIVVLSPLLLLPFALRQTGEWRALRRTIQAHELSLRVYAAAHPGWTNKQIVAGFLRDGPQLPEFHFEDTSVTPVYFKVSDWRDTVPRIVVAYNACNNALFDPDTMWVEQSD